MEIFNFKYKLRGVLSGKFNEKFSELNKDGLSDNN